MKFERLRLLGFKSFCEPTDFLIEPGLTGVVGPNGCGKSNLVEALRWVMGENSYKNMRASGMDDVIFSGSGIAPGAQHGRSRPGARQFVAHRAGGLQRRRRDRGHAPHRARAGLDLSRQRQAKCAPATCSFCSPTPPPARARPRWCARARSARSFRPSRRRAAAFSKTPPASPGLHSRRHEAELRLKAAAENLTRLEDVLKQVDGQVDSLKRQARQATRLPRARGANPQERGAGGASRLSARRAAAAAAPLQKLDAGRRSVAGPHAGAGGGGEVCRRSPRMSCRRCATKEAEAGAGAAAPRRRARGARGRRAARQAARSPNSQRHIEQFGRDLERERALIAGRGRGRAAARGRARRAARRRRPRRRPRDRGASAARSTSKRRWRRPRPSCRARRSSSPASTPSAAALEAALRDENQRVARFEAELDPHRDGICADRRAGRRRRRSRASRRRRSNRRRRTRAPAEEADAGGRRPPRGGRATPRPPRARRWSRRRCAPQRLETESPHARTSAANRLRRPLGAGGREHDRREGL